MEVPNNRNLLQLPLEIWFEILSNFSEYFVDLKTKRLQAKSVLADLWDWSKEFEDMSAHPIRNPLLSLALVASPASSPVHKYCMEALYESICIPLDKDIDDVITRLRYLPQFAVKVQKLFVSLGGEAEQIQIKTDQMNSLIPLLPNLKYLQWNCDFSMSESVVNTLAHYTNIETLVCPRPVYTKISMLKSLKTLQLEKSLSVSRSLSTILSEILPQLPNLKSLTCNNFRVEISDSLLLTLAKCPKLTKFQTEYSQSTASAEGYQRFFHENNKMKIFEMCGVTDTIFASLYKNLGNLQSALFINTWIDMHHNNPNKNINLHAIMADYISNVATNLTEYVSCIKGDETQREMVVNALANKPGKPLTRLCILNESVTNSQLQSILIGCPYLEKLEITLDAEKDLGLVANLGKNLRFIHVLGDSPSPNIFLEVIKLGYGCKKLRQANIEREAFIFKRFADDLIFKIDDVSEPQIADFVVYCDCDYYYIVNNTIAHTTTKEPDENSNKRKFTTDAVFERNVQQRIDTTEQ